MKRTGLILAGVGIAFMAMYHLTVPGMISGSTARAVSGLQKSETVLTADAVSVIRKLESQVQNLHGYSFLWLALTVVGFFIILCTNSPEKRKRQKNLPKVEIET
jgi:hypothetical protein